MTVAWKGANRYLVNTIMKQWQINIREDGCTLLDALALRVPSAPRSYLHQLCKKQRVSVAGEAAHPEQKVRFGETVSVKVSGRWQEILASSPLLPEQILYEDIQCIAINKPAGLATHRAHGHKDDLLLRVQDYLRQRGESFMVAPVQRLDIGTSGIVLFGKGKNAIGQLGKMIMAGGATKRYLALAFGQTPPSGQLNTPVSAKGAIKEALTKFGAIASTDNHTLLELELVTGRRHQIRQQLATAGHPLYGDQRYGPRHPDTESRLMLHSYQLALVNPETGQQIDICCPLENDFTDKLLQLGFDQAALAGYAG